MLSSKLRAVVFILLLAGQEAVRVSTVSDDMIMRRARINTSEGVGTPVDLDWKGCGSVTCMKGALEGCEREYIWLDKPGQSCRYTQSYKLANNQDAFMKSELARLHAKSEKFKRTGCIFGYAVSFDPDTYLFKCSRRMKQIVRLLHYVNKVKAAALDDETHPAHEYAISSEVSDMLSEVGENMAAGFAKYQGQYGGDLDYVSAYKDMLTMPEKESAAIQECPDCAVSETPEDTGAQETGFVTFSMLKMVGIDLDEEQKAELLSVIEEQKNKDVDVDDVINSIESDIDKTTLSGKIAEEVDPSELDTQQREAMEAQIQEDMKDMDDTEEESGPSSPEGANGSLAELSTGGSVSTQGTGPLKWLFKHGLGWVISRIAWLVLYLVGTAVGIIKAGVVFPLLFVGCMLLKFARWWFADLLYEGGVEGNWKQVSKGFANIGKCAPEMWDLVGYDSGKNGENLPGQIFVQPGRWASKATGVHHLYKESKALCATVVCGQNAVCNHGQCFCNNGFYGVGDGMQGPDCGQLQTANGCTCMTSWQKVTGYIFTSQHLGCPRRGQMQGRCKVDKSHPSYATCSSKLKQTRTWINRKRLSNYDSCTPTPRRAEVTSVKVVPAAA